MNRRSFLGIFGAGAAAATVKCAAAKGQQVSKGFAWDSNKTTSNQASRAKELEVANQINAQRSRRLTGGVANRDDFIRDVELIRPEDAPVSKLFK